MKATTIKETTVQRVLDFLGGKRSQLEKELKFKEGAYEKVKKFFRQSSSGPSWRRWFVAKIKEKQAQGLKAEIIGQREEIGRYIQAEADLEKGKFELAISLLGEIAENAFPWAQIQALQFLYVGSFIEGMDSIGVAASAPSLEPYRQILGLQRKLVALQEAHSSSIRGTSRRGPA